MKKALVANGVARNKIKTLINTMEDGEKKKQSLQEAFLKRAKEVAEKNKDNMIEDSEQVKVTKEKKKATKEKKVTEEKGSIDKIKELNKAINESKTTIENLKQEKYEISVELKEVASEFKVYKNTVNQQSARIKELEDKLKVEEEYNNRLVNDNSKTLDKLRVANEKVTLQANKLYILLRDSRDAKNKLKSILDGNSEDSEFSNVINKLKKRIAELEIDNIKISEEKQEIIEAYEAKLKNLI